MPYVQYRDLDIWIDEEDIKWLAKYTYYPDRHGYLKRNNRWEESSSLHRDIMQCPTGMEVDHINGNKRDNRKQNLRIVTKAENSSGFQSRYKNNKSGCPGVRWDKRDNKWVAEIRRNGKHIYLGSTDDFFEACCLRKSAENRYRNNS